jgi:hypothetical protein
MPAPDRVHMAIVSLCLRSWQLARVRPLPTAQYPCAELTMRTPRPENRANALLLCRCESRQILGMCELLGEKGKLQGCKEALPKMVALEGTGTADAEVNTKVTFNNQQRTHYNLQHQFAKSSEVTLSRAQAISQHLRGVDSLHCRTSHRASRCDLTVTRASFSP